MPGLCRARVQHAAGTQVGAQADRAGKLLQWCRRRVQPGSVDRRAQARKHVKAARAKHARAVLVAAIQVGLVKAPAGQFRARTVLNQHELNQRRRFEEGFRICMRSKVPEQTQASAAFIL